VGENPENDICTLKLRPSGFIFSLLVCVFFSVFSAGLLRLYETVLSSDIAERAGRHDPRLLDLLLLPLAGVNSGTSPLVTVVADPASSSTTSTSSASGAAAIAVVDKKHEPKRAKNFMVSFLC
jgi:hypothetical protein